MEKNIDDVLKAIEAHELIGAKIIVPPQRYKEILDWKYQYQYDRIPMTKPNYLEESFYKHCE